MRVRPPQRRIGCAFAATSQPSVAVQFERRLEEHPRGMTASLDRSRLPRTKRTRPTSPVPACRPTRRSRHDRRRLQPNRAPRTDRRNGGDQPGIRPSSVRAMPAQLLVT